MEFRIADTFTDSLARLTNEEQKLVKTAAFDLQMNPAQPGFKLHKMDRARDKNFFSAYVNMDIRLILHRTEHSLLLCYVDHHDKAYLWAERRKLETHPKTGAAQLVEIRETVKEIEVPVYVEVSKPSLPKPLLFHGISNEELLSYGIPEEWLPDVLSATEDTILELADHLPREAAEAVLQLATGSKPVAAEPIGDGADPFAHRDAIRRFRSLNTPEELAQALDFPWEKWSIFLHPAQKDVVERNYGGPAKVAGSAGTGKTIVALHRAVYLAKSDPDSRVLLTTFSDTLANALRTKLRRLISSSPRLGERLEVSSMSEIGQRLYEANVGSLSIATTDEIDAAIVAASTNMNQRFAHHFVTKEWNEVVDSWQLRDWEQYRDVSRLGRKTRLPEKQRQALWAVFEQVYACLDNAGKLTLSAMFTKLAEVLCKKDHPPFDYIIIDEAQDISIPQLKFLAAISGNRPNSLFFAGDMGQRIFQQPFSWKSLGIDVRGRSNVLKINYRTSHQIRQQADRLLDQEIADVDGNIEKRRGTVSVFNSPKPEIQILSNVEEETSLVTAWITGQVRAGLAPHEIGIFVRSKKELCRAETAAGKSGIPYVILDERVETANNHLAISTMHLAKGLEFRAVAVIACDDDVVPQAQRIDSATDEADLQEVYNTERHLLYVACTRARDGLLVSGIYPASEFLDDLGA